MKKDIIEPTPIDEKIGLEELTISSEDRFMMRQATHILLILSRIAADCLTQKVIIIPHASILKLKRNTKTNSDPCQSKNASGDKLYVTSLLGSTGNRFF